jgi:hypothetical protein
MTLRRIAIVAALAGFATAAALPADAASPRRSDPQASIVDQLNQEALDRARAGQNSPTPGPDTTQNLNRISEDAAKAGQNMNRAPMPFR